VTREPSIHPGPQVQTEIIDSWAGFSRLHEQWNSVLRRSAADSVFLTWEWIEAWRQAAGSGVTPVIALARHEGELVGIAPFYLSQLRLARVTEFSVLRILADYPTGAEYPDWILVREHTAEAGRALAQSLASLESWDCAWLAGASRVTGAVSRMTSACQTTDMVCRTRPRTLSAVKLPPTFDEYQRALSRNSRSSLHRQKNRLLEAGTIGFDYCRREEDIPRYLDALVQLNTRRWHAAGSPGTFVRKPLEERFYRTFAPAAFRLGWLGLFGLTLNGEMSAVQVGYFYGSTFFQLQEGFSPEAPAGIGNHLRARVIEHCIERGIRVYDFLGEFSEHKRRWLSERYEGDDIFILRDPRSLKGRLLAISGRWPTGRILRPVHDLRPGPEDD
jgi:CelD/BcsL family acetyltransferase involved in cellulose biosynthesis